LNVTKNNRRKGKNAERKIAKILRGKRVGVLGKADVEHPLFSFEVKSRKKFVVGSWFSQAVKNCEKGKIPAVVVHITGQHFKNDFVIVRLKDFGDLLGKLK